MEIDLDSDIKPHIQGLVSDWPLPQLIIAFLSDKPLRALLAMLRLICYAITISLISFHHKSLKPQA